MKPILSSDLYNQENKIMLITTISDFRKDIKTYLDKVVKNFETLLINRGKDSGIVIMSLEEYNSLMATHHELSSRKNEMRLDAAIEKLKKRWYLLPNVGFITIDNRIPKIQFQKYAGCLTLVYQQPFVKGYYVLHTVFQCITHQGMANRYFL